MIGLFMIKELYGILYPAFFTAVIIAVSGVPVRVLLKGLKPMWLLFALTMILNLFMTSGTALWQWRFLKITEEGMARGLFMATRLVLLLNVTALLTLTTTPVLLTDGLERIMKRCFIPMAHELAMMMTIALRFIPTLIDETERIMKAQMARGADFESGGLIARSRNLIPLLIPLFVSSFRRADELAMAMEARCYRGGEGRTRLRQLKFESRDIVAFSFISCFALTVIADRFLFRFT
jgi:energy-coupling factor transport system permease protein